MEFDDIRNEIADCEKLLIGIGEAWQAERCPGVEAVYDALARLIREKDYFIVTLATDAKIYESALGSSQEFVHTSGRKAMEIPGGADMDEQTKILMEKLFPVTETREMLAQRIVAPCQNEDGPQWDHYLQWLSGTLNQKLLILELGVGFEHAGVIRFPFERTAFINQKARMIRVNGTFPQISEELQAKAIPVAQDSVEWVRALCAGV